MAYVPVSVNVYCAAYSGMMGALAAARQTTDNVATDYDHDTKVSGAFAAALDTALNDSTPNVLQLGEIESIISELFYTAFPTGSGSESKTAPNYVALAGAVVARLTQADAFVAGEGIVPPGVPNNPEINVAQVRYVTKGGNDATGDGSLGAPYLTVAAAMASITDADPVTKPYAVQAGPGVFATPFTIKNGVYVIGWGRGPGNFNGGPLEAATILAPTAAQCLDNASFAGAGNKAAGIRNCGLSTALVASFLAAGSIGNATFFIENVITDSNVTVTGNNTGLDYCYINRLYSNAAVPTTLTIGNMGGSNINDISSDFLTLNTTYTQSGAFQGFHFLNNASGIKNLTLTWTSAAIGNFMQVVGSNQSVTGTTTLTGDGAVLTGSVTRELTMPDAASTLAFTNSVGRTMAGATGGTTIVNCTPTNDRTLTITNVASALGGLPTKIIVRNHSAGPVINLSFPTGNVNGNPTYIPPGGTVVITGQSKSGTNLWYVEPYTQGGSVTLTNGLSALVPCDMSGASFVVASLRTFNGACGSPFIPALGRVFASRLAGGGFVLHAINPATGADVATDQGTYDWHVVGLSDGT